MSPQKTDGTSLDEPKGQMGVFQTLLKDVIPQLPKSSKPFVVLVLIFALLALGVAVFVGETVVRETALVLAAALCSLSGTYIYMWSRRESPGTPSIRRHVHAVNGYWWQLGTSKSAHGVSYIHLHLSDRLLDQGFSGTAWNAEGQILEHFQAESVGFIRSSPLSVFYEWKGHYDLHPGEVSGIGKVVFESDRKGSGWFTRGDIESPDGPVIADVWAFALRRATTAERKIIDSGQPKEIRELLRAKVADWNAECAPLPDGSPSRALDAQ